MPTPEAEAIVREWFERVWNEADETAIDRLLSPTAVAYGLPGAPIQGAEAFKPFAKGFRSAFPDLRIEVLRTATEGCLCAAHCRVSGTHRGEGLGFAATGREMAMEGMVFMRVEGGLIHEGWNSFDFLIMYQQLGVNPQLA
ncbi:MAG: ester cyclase [Acidobacteria bacterium]|nr:ester cyclase [Acidobacteriota bacterium]